MKIIVMPDSFKGTLSSVEVCRIIKENLHGHQVTAIPIADGGEGTLDCFRYFNETTTVKLEVKGPLFENIEAEYVISGETAIIEMAAAAGFSLVPDGTTPMDTTTFGVGQIISDALDRGCRKIILGLGGSSTNDCGAGMAAALGVEFYDAKGKYFVPTGRNLGNVAAIKMKKVHQRLADTDVQVMCDVKNPLYGNSGAAFIFAPQKGASDEEVVHLNNQLQVFAERIREDIGIDVSDIPGGGAAGGMGAGAVAFIGGKLVSGIEVVMDMAGFDGLLEVNDLVITGEGSFDKQSLDGKVVSGICSRARSKGVPVVIVAGRADENLKLEGVTCIFSCGEINWSHNVKEQAAENLRETIRKLHI